MTIPTEPIGVIGAQSASSEKKASVLRGAKRERVHAHAARAVQLAAAGIVAGALQFEKPGAQVTERVAADQQGVAGGLADGAIKRQGDFGGGPAAVREVPTIVGELRAHRETPPAQQIEAGVIVLDQSHNPQP